LASHYWPSGDRDAEPPVLILPAPTDPPHLAEGETYERCLVLLANDPVGASTQAEASEANSGGADAVHCRALAQIASGRPELGAAQLESLANSNRAPDRAALFGQAVQALLMAGQPERALAAASDALVLAPDDIGLLVDRATAADALQRSQPAIEDLDHALKLDAKRVDALVLRAAVWRRLNNLDQAAADVGRAIEIDPRNPEALLERGILRQRQGNSAGARADWQNATTIDPNSTTAELAAQNLALLEAGTDRR
jgi:tetratricopeptide (TPR) repeat protein